MDSELLKALLPAIFIQLVIQLVALIHLIKNKKTRNLSPWMWAGIIIFGQILGSMAYFFIGREED